MTQEPSEGVTAAPVLDLRLGSVCPAGQFRRQSQGWTPGQRPPVTNHQSLIDSRHWSPGTADNKYNKYVLGGAVPTTSVRERPVGCSGPGFGPRGGAGGGRRWRWEGAALGVDGDDLATAAPHHQYPVQALRQHLQKLHVCTRHSQGNTRTDTS